ncbi:MAG: hypothetical protein MI975_20830 [Cytophagales bacterium]|nr:hypothetical protein [Cytophagales bacterium]
MTNYLFVVNPIAGGNDKSSFYQFIEDEIKTSNLSFEIFATTGYDDELKLQKLYEKVKPKVIVAIGGDGTLQLVAKTVKKTSTKIGLMPFGSANGMAKELGIPKIPDRTLSLIPSERFMECWQIIKNEHIRKIDLVQINKKNFSIHLSDIGLNAKIVKRFETEKARGYLGYARLFIKELKQRKRISYQLFINGKRHAGKGYMIVLANATMYGTGAVINPAGKLNDGFFEICIVKQINLIALLRSLMSIFKVNLRKREDLTKVFSCKRASIELKCPETLQIDGEAIGETKNVEVKIIPDAINMITPS